MKFSNRTWNDPGQFFTSPGKTYNVTADCTDLSALIMASKIRDKASTDSSLLRLPSKLLHRLSLLKYSCLHMNASAEDAKLFIALSSAMACIVSSMNFGFSSKTWRAVIYFSKLCSILYFDFRCLSAVIQAHVLDLHYDSHRICEQATY